MVIEIKSGSLLGSFSGLFLRFTEVSKLQKPQTRELLCLICSRKGSPMKFDEFSLSARPGRTPVRAVFCPADRYLAVLNLEAAPLVFSLDNSKAQNLKLEQTAGWADFRLVPSPVATRLGENVELALVVPQGNKVRRFNLDLQQEQVSIVCDRVTNCAYSPDGSLLATGNKQGQVTIWRLTDASNLVTHDTSMEPVQIGQFKLSRNAVISLSFNSNNLLLYAVLAGGEVRVIDITDESDLQLRPDGTEWKDFECLSVHAHPQRPKQVAFCGLHSRIWIYDGATERWSTLEPGLGSYVSSVRMAGENSVIAVGQSGIARIDRRTNAVDAVYKHPVNGSVLGGSIRRDMGRVFYIKPSE